MSFESEVYTPDETKTHRSSPRLASLLCSCLTCGDPIYDFGCGNGYYLDQLDMYFQGNEYNPRGQIIGVEGSREIYAQIYPYIVHPVDIATMNLTLGPPGTVLCFEVLEHIHQSRLICTVRNLVRHCKEWLFISWAVPGQKGLRHVSCMDPADVIMGFEMEGFEFQEDLSKEFREEAGKDLWWFKESIYIFKKRK